MKTYLFEFCEKESAPTFVNLILPDMWARGS